MSRSNMITEESPSPMALHRLWNLGRRLPAPSNSVFDEPATMDDIFIPDQVKI